MPNRFDLANAIRALSMDAIQKANSGHPGAPMGMADIAEVLFNDFLKHNPNNSKWFDRDRFVLSNGHGSMLIYSLLHLTGYDLSLDDIKSFRKLHSKTPGHPEYGYTDGVETTTGPLGQGITNAVGMALAERTLAAEFNKDDLKIVDHFTYCFLGDGCMMEGISHEGCSLAGTLGLGKLIAFWDDNGISIDGEVEDWFTDDTAKRFESYGWQVITDIDGHNPDEIKQAIIRAQDNTTQPTLICCKTVIGFGSPNKAGTHDCHGAPLGADEIIATREKLGWKFGDFEVPQDIYDAWNAKDTGAKKEEQWQNTFAKYKEKYPVEAAEFTRRMQGDLPNNWDEIKTSHIKDMDNKAESPATRQASNKSINALASHLPEFLGGSADLTPSNLTSWDGCKTITKSNANGNYISYGVREFGMAAIMNGLALHGGLLPFGGTFLMFSEYARNAMRMAALMKIRSIFVYTHDSIGLGEDGPTHQPVEQIATMRLIPNMSVWRPCDTVETAVAWSAAIEKTTGPTSLVFSRQGLPFQARTEQQIENIKKGGYILQDCDGFPDVILIATGSEVTLAVEAAKQISDKKIRIISMPSVDIFESQSSDYKNELLPYKCTTRVIIEAGATASWYKYAAHGTVIGLDRFGESAPADKLFEEFGFTVSNVVETIKKITYV
jgi:transketolase